MAAVDVTFPHPLRSPSHDHSLATDREVLVLIPEEKSNGAIVCEQLGQLIDRCGVPLAMLSDRGSDLKKGIELLQQDHPGVISLDDIVHLVSRLIEKILLADARWDEYRRACCSCAMGFVKASWLISNRRVPRRRRAT